MVSAATTPIIPRVISVSANVNAKYFTEQFKKSVGMTPSEYKTHQGS